jgi:hypothetical protein
MWAKQGRLEKCHNEALAGADFCPLDYSSYDVVEHCKPLIARVLS